MMELGILEFKDGQLLMRELFHKESASDSEKTEAQSYGKMWTSIEERHLVVLNLLTGYLPLYMFNNPTDEMLTRLNAQTMQSLREGLNTTSTLVTASTYKK